VDTSGHYITAARQVPTASAITGGSTNVAPQLSIEVGLWSGSKFGRANYGKMYLPHTRMLLDPGTPRVSAANASTTATAMAAFITGLNGSAGGWTGTPEVQVMSRVGSGTTKTVTTVRVGRVIDTQRRRRDRLIEDYQSHTV
ncbi:MAG: hypothetical protein ACOYBX_16765, partial [Mycobacterium sp.]